MNQRRQQKQQQRRPITSVEMRKLNKKSSYVCKEDLWDTPVMWLQIQGGEEHNDVQKPRTNKKETRGILMFRGMSKGMIVNIGNLDFLEKHWGIAKRGIREDWGGREIGLYVDPSIMFGKKRKGGVRMCLRDSNGRIGRDMYSGEMHPEAAYKERKGKQPPSQPGGGNFAPDPEWSQGQPQQRRQPQQQAVPVFFKIPGWSPAEQWSGKPLAGAPADVVRGYLDVLVTLRPKNVAAHNAHVAAVEAALQQSSSRGADSADDAHQDDEPPADVELPTWEGTQP